MRGLFIFIKWVIVYWGMVIKFVVDLTLMEFIIGVKFIIGTRLLKVFLGINLVKV